MKRVLRRLLWTRKEHLPLFLAASGFALGLFILFGAIRFGGHLFGVLNPGDGDGDSRYIIINKKVSLKHTVGFGSTAFSPEELERLRQQPFVRDVGPIVTTSFTVAGSATLGMGGLQSELFFEAVDDRFLDVQPAGWHWQEGDSVIPAILSRDFLALYNFGYASAKGFPQLTEETIGFLQARVVCSGQVQRSFTGKIVGFSDRFSTILVPLRFITWANEHIGGRAAPPVARAILKVASGREEAVQAFLERESYETNREKLPVTRAARVLQLALAVVSLFGGILLLVSAMSLVLLIQLLIQRAWQDLRLLHQLGYDDATLARSYLQTVLLLVTVCFGLAGIGVIAVGFIMAPFFAKLGYTLSPIPDPLTGLLFLAAWIGVATLFGGLIARAIKRIE
jgi:hypothetical protein